MLWLLVCALWRRTSISKMRVCYLDPLIFTDVVHKYSHLYTSCDCPLISSWKHESSTQYCLLNSIFYKKQKAISFKKSIHLFIESCWVSQLGFWLIMRLRLSLNRQHPSCLEISSSGIARMCHHPWLQRNPVCFMCAVHSAWMWVYISHVWGINIHVNTLACGGLRLTYGVFFMSLHLIYLSRVSVWTQSSYFWLVWSANLVWAFFVSTSYAGDPNLSLHTHITITLLLTNLEKASFLKKRIHFYCWVWNGKDEIAVSCGSEQWYPKDWPNMGEL